MGQAVRRIDEILCRAGLVVSAVAMVALMALTGANVVMRLAGLPLGAVYELAGYCGALAVAFALAETQRSGGNITVELFTVRLPERARSAMLLGNAVLFALFFAVIAYQVGCRGLTVRSTGEVSETLKMIYHPFIFCVAGGFALLSLSLLSSALRAVLPAPVSR